MMKSSVLIIPFLVSINYFALAQQSGDLDPSFGPYGVRVTDITGGDDEAYGMVIQPDGKILAAGRAGNDFGLARYNTDGTLDSSFGINGTVIHSFSINGDMATCLVLQPDGKIVTGGITYDVTSTVNDFAVMRYNPDGSVDSSFGTNGIDTADFEHFTDEILAIALQPDGKIVAGGTASSINLGLIRYNADGSVDSSFGTNGKVFTNLSAGGDERIYALAIQPDGKILATGDCDNSVFVVRYNADGTFDNTFGNNGVIITKISAPVYVDDARAMALLADGKFLVAGMSNNSFLLLRYNSSGTIDSTFGINGHQTTDFGGELPSTDQAHAIAVQPDGMIVLAGHVIWDVGNTHFAISRYHADGSIDHSFGGNGIVITAFNFIGATAFGVAVQQDGKIVAGGYAINTSFDFGFARYYGACGPTIAAFNYENTLCTNAEVYFTNNSTNADTYSWDLGDGTTSTELSPYHIYPSAGNYMVTLISAKQACGISDTITTSITVTNTVSTAVITPMGSLTFCDGQSVLFNANTGAGFTYKWKLDGVNIPGETNASYVATESGEYKVVVTNAAGCPAASTATNVTVNPVPSAHILNGASVGMCEDTTYLLKANNDLTYAYQWLNNGSIVPGATSKLLTVENAGNYSVIETNSFGCIDTSSVTVVILNANPVVDISASNVIICANDTVTLSGNGALNYVWQPGNIAGQIIQVEPVNGTTYSVEGTDANGCKDQDSITIQVLPLPVVNLGNDTTICDTLNFILDAGSGFSSYLWSTGATTQTISVSVTNDYSVQVKDNNGCSGTDSLHVTVAICTGAELTSNEFGVNLYPNPTSGNFILSFINPSNLQVKVELQNVLGQTVEDIFEGITGKQFQKEVDVAWLSVAVYYVRIAIGNTILTKELVVAR